MWIRPSSANMGHRCVLHGVLTSWRRVSGSEMAQVLTTWLVLPLSGECQPRDMHIDPGSDLDSDSSDSDLLGSSVEDWHHYLASETTECGCTKGISPYFKLWRLFEV